MAIFEFNELELPEFEDRLTVPRRRRLLENISSLMMAQRLEVFDTENDGKWVPLSVQAYRARLGKVPSKNRKKKNAVKILQDTGVLRQSFTSASGPGSSQKEVQVTDETARLATHVEYAAIHNYGGTIKIPENKNGFGRGITIPAHTVTIPARPFDEFRQKDKDEIELLTRKFLDE